MREDSEFVLDTHTLIWWLEESARLPNRIRRLLDAMDSGLGVGVVPTIVLAEMISIAEKGLLRLDIDKVLADIMETPNFEVIPFDSDMVLRMHKIRGLELHDRIIVATALSLNLGLITRDGQIRESGLVECIW